MKQNAYFSVFDWTLNFDDWPLLSQLTYEKAIYLKREPYYPLLFTWDGGGDPQDIATAIFSQRALSIPKLFNDISFVSEFF